MSALPLQGIRVLDLGQFIAAPFCTQWLAWLGAEVIVVESRRHMTSRGAPPFAKGEEGNPNGSGYFNLLYGSKKSCTINLAMSEGCALVARLASVADVMIDNFSSGVLNKLGLGYDSIRKIRPDIVMLSCTAFGNTGPMSAAKGFHSAVNLFSGLADVTGYTGGHGRIAGGCLPDPLGGVAAAFAILAALHHRRRTGRGQYIDLAMYEVLMSTLPASVIAYTMAQLEPIRNGNRDAHRVPHGVFRCKGLDEWVAISVEDDASWERLSTLIGGPLRAARYADLVGRRANEAVLEQRIQSWTRERTASEVTELLQGAGVAAGSVLRADQLLEDEQLVASGVIVENEHPVGGKCRQVGLPWRSDSIGAEYKRAPLLGEHTHDVLTELLGISPAEFQSLSERGVLT